jgi:hypothetical protein
MLAMVLAGRPLPGGAGRGLVVRLAGTWLGVFVGTVVKVPADAVKATT